MTSHFRFPSALQCAGTGTGKLPRPGTTIGSHSCSSCPNSYMGFRESSPGFEGLTFFLAVSLFGLRSGPFLRPGPLAKRPARAGSVKETRTCAPVRASLSLTDAETWNASERRRTTNLGIGLFIRQRKKTAEPYIRRDSSSSPNPYPTCWEVRGRAGRDQSFGRHIEAMNGPGHTSIPVRRVTRRASASPGRASDKLVTPP